MKNKTCERKVANFYCKFDPEGIKRPPSQDGKCSQALGVF